eukprot:3841887-Rhodomonas_salina.1
MTRSRGGGTERRRPKPRTTATPQTTPTTTITATTNTTTTNTASAACKKTPQAPPMTVATPACSGTQQRANKDSMQQPCPAAHDRTRK